MPVTNFNFSKFFHLPLFSSYSPVISLLGSRFFCVIASRVNVFLFVVLFLEGDLELGIRHLAGSGCRRLPSDVSIERLESIYQDLLCIDLDFVGHLRLLFGHFKGPLS